MSAWSLGRCDASRDTDVRICQKKRKSLAACRRRRRRRAAAVAAAVVATHGLPPFLPRRDVDFPRRSPPRRRSAEAARARSFNGSYIFPIARFALRTAVVAFSSYNPRFNLNGSFQRSGATGIRSGRLFLTEERSKELERDKHASTRWYVFAREIHR